MADAGAPAFPITAQCTGMAGELPGSATRGLPSEVVRRSCGPAAGPVLSVGAAVGCGRERADGAGSCAFLL